MRVTKTRLMRSKTINPNPPICRSKEPSLTVINIYSCSTKQLLNRIEQYNWNLAEAQAAANGGEGTYTIGYFYEAAFHKYTDLSQKHCPTIGFFRFWWQDDDPSGQLLDIDIFPVRLSTEKYGHENTTWYTGSRGTLPIDEWNVVDVSYEQIDSTLWKVKATMIVFKTGPQPYEGDIEITQSPLPPPHNPNTKIVYIPDIP